MEEMSEHTDNDKLFDLSEAKISGISEMDSKTELDLNNLESLVIEKKPKIYENDKPYSFCKDEERADVYIKNYLMKFNMQKSLKVMEQEFFELLSKGEVKVEQLPKVPKVYIESEYYQEQIGNLQKELDEAKIYAEKANSLFLKLQKAKESEKIRHRRVQQEKQKSVKEIEKLKKVYEKDNKIYKTLKSKYWGVTNESLMQEQKLKGVTSKVENLREQEEKLAKLIDEAKKQRERKCVIN